MKVALVLTGGLHPSGREQVIPVWLWLLERLASRHIVHAFTLRHLAEQVTYPLAGATVHDLGRPTGRWAQWQSLRQALVRHGPFDVIHGHWADPAGFLAALAGRRLRVPSIVSCDSGEFTALPEIGYGLQRTAPGRALVALTCRLATRVHVTTRYMETLAAAHGVRAVRIPMGVDLARVTRSDGPASSQRLEGAPWQLLQTASLNPVKDQVSLLRAMAILRRTIDVRLDLVGEDAFGDGRLRAEAAHLGIEHATRFHGFLPADALAPLRGSAHLYVQSSLHEAAGIAVLEAAATGLPIVGTRVGYVSDWAPGAAVAVPAGDEAALAEAIVTTLGSVDERKRIAREARRFATAHDVEWTAGALTDLYESVRRR